MEGYVGPDFGYRSRVLRVLSAATLLVVVAAGCGGVAGPQRPAFHGVPRVLAQRWEGQASAIAAAASTGDSCRAMQLADSLRTEVVAAKDEVPARLRPPLLTGVNALADRIACTPPTVAPEKKPKPPPEKHDHHDHHKHGDGNGGGNEG